MYIQYTYINEDSKIKPTQYCLKKGGRRRKGLGSLIKGGSLIQEHFTYLWKNHNETPP
jgi:hypothetical protein